MPLEFVLEESDFKGYIPDGKRYRARLIEITERHRKDRDNNPITRLGWKFRLISDDDFDNWEVWGDTSDKFIDHPKCRFKNWAEALLGRPIPPQYLLRVPELYDKDCIVIIEKWENEAQGKEGNKVKEIEPTTQSMNAMASATVDERF